MREPSTENLIRLIHHKHQVLVQLRDVGLRQMDLVERGEVSALLKLLAAKQHLIAAIQDVERKLAPYHADDPEQRRWPSAEARAQCAEQAAACQTLLSEIVQAEKTSETKMQARRNEVAARLREVHSAVEARGAYQAHRLSRNDNVYTSGNANDASRTPIAGNLPEHNSPNHFEMGVDLISDS